MYLAASLLSDDRMTVGAVTERIGYESEAAFSKAFKRHFSVPPRVYRGRPSPGRAPRPSRARESSRKRRGGDARAGIGTDRAEAASLSAALTARVLLWGSPCHHVKRGGQPAPSYLRSHTIYALRHEIE